MSLLPEDDDGMVPSLLPDDEEDIPMFVDDGSGKDTSAYEAKKRSVIPKYKHLMPKKNYASTIGVLTFVIYVGFSFLILLFLLNAGFVFQNPATIIDALQTLISNPGSRGDLILIIVFLFFMIIVGRLNYTAQRKVSSCPVCSKKNYKNYHVCQKCEYIFLGRDIIDKEIISCRFNNLDGTPGDIRQEFLDRRLADLTEDHITKILKKNHFL